MKSAEIGSEKRVKVTFFSNFLNHHQLPFCIAMDKLTEGQFTFVATTPVPQERLQMGYYDMNKQYPFVLATYDSRENEWIAQRLATHSDVIITGSAPEIYTKMRIEQGKLTFRYSERIYKRGTWRAFSPRGFRNMMENHRKYRNEPLYMLCASAYAPFDFSLTGSYLGKTFKWGYFPEVKIQNVDELMERKGSRGKTSILWVGRLIEWKHPDHAIRLAEKLKRNGYDFELSVIGNGALEPMLQRMIHEKQLEDCVSMLGAMSPEAVRKHMEAADIFLFTSDFNEGWGAVLNEALNSGCAVLASHAIGSVPFLIRDGENGFVYKNGDENGLFNRVLELIDHPQKREQMGRMAYQTMAEQWNAETAAKRFLQLCQAIQAGKTPDLFEDGPCSRAKILRKSWYKKK